MLIVGTRPEAIKLEPVAAGLRGRGLSPTLIFTGQHPELDSADYRLAGFPAVRLDCVGELDPNAHVRAVTKALAPVLHTIRPALTIVQGDTSSALGGALAARLTACPRAHVEAGLRSHDRNHPWPEEEYRVAIDSDCDLLFAPTELSAANLRREGVRGEIHVTGNSGIDAARRVIAATAAPDRDNALRVLVTCHRRENWIAGLPGICEAILTIAADGLATVEVLLHPNGTLATRIRGALGRCAAILFRPPCGHADAIAAMRRCDLILSDSGGMQEEAAALGVPLLVLRERTERPEAMVDGCVELVGTEPARIVAAVRRRLAASSATASMPFGDGRSGDRIAAIIEQWLEQRGALSPSMTDSPRQSYGCHHP